MKKQFASIITFSFVMSIMLSACGNGETVSAPDSVERDNSIEAVVEEIPLNDLEEVKDSLSENSVETEQVKTESDSNDNKELQLESLESSEQQPKEETGEQPEEQLKEEVRDATEAPALTATLSGHIDSIGNGEFKIRKSDVIKSDVIVSSGEDAERVSVVYTDSTEFVLCATTDGGITAHYSPASASDLCNDCMVEIQGFYDDNTFVAGKVTIYTFQ